MNFKLKYIKGTSRKKYKEWWCGKYRITWRNEAHGVKVPPGFFACILINGQIDFVERKGTYKTFNAAVKACEIHARDNAP
jgi:hypothetical protein